MNTNPHLLAWDYASIKVLDVRFEIVGTQQTHRAYQVPANLFLIVIQGRGQVEVNAKSQTVQAYYIAHIPKGSWLKIHAEVPFYYYVLFYRATLPLVMAKEHMQIIKAHKPFQLHYSLIPQNGIALHHNVRQMHEKWQEGHRVSRYYCKGALYNFTYLLLAQGNDQSHSPNVDLCTSVKHYIEQNYQQHLTLTSIADALNYSVAHLSTTFKEKTGYSVIDYVIQTRLSNAERWLRESDAPLKEIAEQIGYKDPYYFSRLFKKHKHCSPLQYRQQYHQHPMDASITSLTSSIVQPSISRYIESDSQYNKEVYIPMVRSTRTSLLATLLICFTLLFSGCTTTNTQTIGKTNEVQTEYVTYKASNGEVEIPKNPKRVVVLANSYAGYLLALGIKPIGMSKFALKNPYFEGKVDGVENIGDEQSLEKITELNPDLIIAFNREGVENLEKIAPTVAITYGEKDYKEQLLAFGDMLNKKEEAEDWIAQWEEKIEQHKSEIQAIVGDRTVSIIGGGEKELMVFGENFGRGGEIVYEGFNLNMPPLIKEEAVDTKQGYAAVSLEVLNDFIGDYIFIDGQDVADYLATSSLWKDLPAVKENKMMILDTDASYFSDPVSLDGQLDEIIAFFRSHQ